MLTTSTEHHGAALRAARRAALADDGTTAPPMDVLDELDAMASEALRRREHFHRAEGTSRNWRAARTAAGDEWWRLVRTSWAIRDEIDAECP